MKRFLLLFSLLLFSWGYCVQVKAKALHASTMNETSTTLYFTAWLNNGETNAYAFNEHPVITFEDANIIIETRSERVEYSQQSVCKFTIEKTPPQPSDINELQISTQIQMRQGDIYILGGKTGMVVKIYSLNGTLVDTHQANTTGEVVIHTSQYAKGIYLIQTETLTHKFIKK